MAKPVYSLGEIIDRLDGDAWWGTGTIKYAVSVTAAFGGSENTGFQAMTTHMKDMATTAFELWDDLIAPAMNKVSSGEDIGFGYSSTTIGDATYTSTEMLSQSGGRWDLSGAQVWLSSSWSSHDDDADIDWGEYGFLTYIHEIGHALGLDHPGNYNGTADYGSDAVYRQDTVRYTVMSYFDADEDGSGTDHYGSGGLWMFPSTPMLHDVAAIQEIYGADTTTRTGNTTYGFHSNAGRDAFDFGDNPDPIVTIWDAGGTDTLDVSGYSQDQDITLKAGEYSSVGALTNNVAIAFGVVIENAKGGRGDDQILGNSADNKLYGKAGDDVARGGAGDDRLDGANGNDKLYGQGGDDVLIGGRGNDRIYGGGGNDTVRVAGDSGDFRVVDRGSYVAVIDQHGGLGSDRLYDVERIVFDDATVML